MRDISAQNKQALREQLRSKILENIAHGAPLSTQLETLVHLVEAQFEGVLCSVLLLDNSGKHLLSGAAPSLPDFYNKAIHGVEIGPGVGSCGTAAYENRQVIVDDIQTHPYWAAYAELAARARLSACWSQPIHDRTGRVLGTFAMYYHEPRAPTQADLELIEPIADLAGLAIERAQNQQQLDKETTWRRILIEQSRDGIVILERDGRVYETNKGFAHMLGYTIEEISSMHVTDWDALLSADQVDAALESVDEEGAHFDTIMRHKNGKLLDVEIKSNAAVFEGRKLIFCVCRDITDRKAAEIALRDSEEQFDLAMRAANDGLWDWDLHTNEVYYSPRWKAMLGYDDHELPNAFATWERLTDPDDRLNTMRLIEACIAGQEGGFVTEFRMRHKDGHWVDILSRAIVVRDEAGQALRMTGTHMDISAQKQLEQRLRDSEAQANLIIDTSPEAIIMTNAAGEMVRINPRVEMLFGYREAELLGNKVEMLLPPGTRDKHVAYRASYMQNPGFRDIREHGINLPLTGQRHDGSEFPVEVGLSPVEIEGQPHVIITLLDISDRKASEQALKESEAQLREERDFVDAVVEAAGSVIVVLDHRGHIVRFNRTAEQTTGYRSEMLLGTPLWQTLIPADERPAVQQRYNNLSEENIVGSFESRWVMQDGTERLFDWRNTVLKDEQGRINYIIAQGYDVTEAREAQQALAEHKDKLEQLVTERTATIHQQARIIDQSHDAIVTTAMDGHITSWNQGAEKLFGIPVTDATGRHISLVFPPHEHHLLQQEIITPLQQQGQYEVETRLLRSNRSLFDAHLSLSLLYDDDGTPTGLTGYCMDISERKQMENALRESESNLAQAQSIAHIGSWQLDMVNNALYWSDETYRIFGLQEGATVSMDYFINCIHPDDTETVMEAWAAAQQQDQAYDIEHRLLIAGKEKWVREQADIKFNANGQAISALGTVQDITELKQAELATQHALSEAQRLAEVRSGFVANMSHEIRTPLNSVLGMAAIGQRGVSPEKAREIFMQITDSGQHLLRLVNDILDFSKIEAGKLTIEDYPFQLVATMDEVIDLVKEHAEDKSLDLRLQFDSRLPAWVKGDALRLRQVLLNLLNNAIKFTKQGTVSLALMQQNRHILFQVKDSGIGMDEELMSQLFTPFHQADSSTTRRFGGTGLGLTISQNLAQLMGGEISVTSQVGKGSTFTLSVPLPETIAPSETSPPDTDIQEQRLNGIRVLAAEDVDVNRLVLEDMLEVAGAQVSFAENGQQAIELLQELGANNIDVVLMDVQMPVMDGHKATQRIREISPSLPVIGLTAHAMEEERKRCFASGMVDHITKPIEPEVLIAAILRAVSSPE